MTADQMRHELTYVYSGPVWRMKVMDMDDRQVIAVYLSMKREGRLKVHAKEKPKRFGEPVHKMCEKYEQLNMFDILKEKENV